MTASLYINDERCDLSKKEAIALTLAINRLTDIESRQGVYSNTFKLPTTDRNRLIFRFPDQVNSNSTIRFRRLPAYITANGVMVVFGHAMLKQSADTIDVVVTGGNAGVVEMIRDKMLTEIDISDLDHIITLANVEANRFNTLADGFVYPDCDYGFLRNLSNPLPFWFLYPAVFAKRILTEIITDAGYTLAGDLNSEPLFDRMVLPFSREFLRVNEDFRTANQFRVKMVPHTLNYYHPPTPSAWLPDEHPTLAVVGFNNDSTDGYFDNPNAFTLGAWDEINWPLTSFPAFNAFYIPTTATNQTVKFTCSFTVSNWINGCRLSLTILTSGYSGTAYPQQPDATYFHHLEANDNGTFTITLEKYIDEITGGQIGIRVRLVGIDWVTPGTNPVTTPNVVFHSGVMWNEVEETHNYANPLDMSINLPDMLQTDFLKYLVNAFGLLIDTDEVNKLVTLTFFDNVPSEIPQDWSNKIDLSETPVVTPDYGDYSETNTVKYGNNTSDEALKLLKDYGKHTIRKTYAKKGEKNLYTSAFSASRPLPERSDRMFIHTFRGKVKEYQITAITSGDGEVTVNSTADLNEGDWVVFTGLDGSLVLNGQSLDGLRGVVIREIISDTVFDILGSTSGVAATTGRMIHIGNPRETQDPKPRVCLHDVIGGSDERLLQLAGGSTVTQVSKLSFIELEWANLYAAYSTILTRIIASPQAVSMLMRLSSSDINQLDYTRPIWIQYFQAYFFLSLVNQYRADTVMSTEVELVKLP